MNHTLKILLSILLLIGIICGTSIYTYHTIYTTSAKLEKCIAGIEDGIEKNDWDETSSSLLSIQDYWNDIQKSWAVMLDHFEIDNIDNTLSKLTSYIKVKDSTMALAEVAALKQYIKHIPEKESLKLSNIF